MSEDTTRARADRSWVDGLVTDSTDDEELLRSTRSILCQTSQQIRDSAERTAHSLTSRALASGLEPPPPHIIDDAIANNLDERHRAFCSWCDFFRQGARAMRALPEPDPILPQVEWHLRMMETFERMANGPRRHVALDAFVEWRRQDPGGLRQDVLAELLFRAYGVTLEPWTVVDLDDSGDQPW